MLMAAAQKGNLEQVRSVLHRDLKIGDLVDYSPAASRNAELVAGAEPHWHVLETHPGAERTAGAHLIARRFGMFVPEKEETIVRRGRKIEQTRLLFRGYIFIFVWDILAHRSRIESIPGIARIMYVGGKPAVISDQLIDEIRAVENHERPLPAVMMPDDMAVPKKKGRWTKKEKRLYELQRAQFERDNEVVACRSWSAFQDGLMTTLDVDGRNQILLKALKLS